MPQPTLHGGAVRDVAVIDGSLQVVHGDLNFGVFTVALQSMDAVGRRLRLNQTPTWRSRTVRGVP